MRWPRDVALALEDERERPAAVDRDVVAAVVAGRRAAQLGMVGDRDAHAGDPAAEAVEDAPAQDGRALER